MSHQRVPIHDVVAAYSAFKGLAEGLGFRVNKGAVREYALENTAYRAAMKSFFSENYARRHSSHTVPVEVVRALDGLSADLAGVVRRRLNGALPKAVQRDPLRLAQTLPDLPSEKRAAAAEAVAASESARFLKRSEMDIAEFHRLIKGYSNGQSLARGRLVSHLHEELRKRGVEMSPDAIEERLRSNTKVRSVPACFAEILSGLDRRFLTGLVQIEDMVGKTPPEEWLENCRRRLGFRSHNALHKALAEATSLNYEAIHKALTKPRPGQRIQGRIQEVLAQWAQSLDKGETPAVDARYLGAPAQVVRDLVTQLSRVIPKGNRLYREAARALGVKSAAVRLTHNDPADQRTYPMEGVRRLQELVKTGRPPASPPVSYLAKAGTRVLASRLICCANEALRRWREDRENYALKRAYLGLRLQLIVAMKQRRTEADWAPVPIMDDEHEHEEEEEASENY
jgi:hypothetical protein